MRIDLNPTSTFVNGTQWTGTYILHFRNRRKCLIQNGRLSQLAKWKSHHGSNWQHYVAAFISAACLQLIRRNKGYTISLTICIGAFEVRCCPKLSEKQVSHCPKIAQPTSNKIYFQKAANVHITVNHCFFKLLFLLHTQPGHNNTFFSSCMGRRYDSIRIGKTTSAVKLRQALTG